MTTERVLAALVIAASVLLLVRLAIGEHWRWRWRSDQALGNAFRGVPRTMRRWLALLRHRRMAARAARIADEAIRRARSRGDWDGNVYKPKSFRKRPRDKQH